ncbi:MAG: UDP-N-acetylenolpyruvoylglucosamine reductase [Nitrospirales bacterium]|nr:MAG: UDP-N-acetylenolpyruvoylglucosamine reductase [Nitrospirales bacterium]
MKTDRPKVTAKRLQRAVQHVQGEVHWNESLSPLLSLQVGGPADVLVFPLNVEDVIRVIVGARTEGIPFVALGGTNVVVRDKGIRGIVMQLKHLTGIHEEAGHVVYAQAGVRLPKLMQFAVGHHLSGMEWAAGIPGTVGGGVVMNAGTQLGEMQEVLHAVDLVNLRGHRVRVEASNMSFAYRKAMLPKGIVVGAWVQLTLSDKEQVETKTKTYLQYRRETQPLTLPNAGSVFKNPPGDSAGRLVEAAGLKGVRIGDAEISTRHANFIVNRGSATASQVLALIRKVRQAVVKKFGVRLQLEWKIIGES